MAVRQWEERKGRIAKEAEVLTKRLSYQDTLNQRAIEQKINGELSKEDFDVMKASIATTRKAIIEQISALDSEKSNDERFD